jgi:DNA helicase-2/ATP-dependent DNA helicase PcrA
MSLNEAQQAAVDHGEGPLLINATAGSGKTRVITHRAARMVERGVDPSRILLVTFTNKAAKEMRERIAKIVSPEAASRLKIGTFHSICVQLLKAFDDDGDREGRTKNFTIYDQSDQEATVKGAISELGLDPKQVKKEDMASFISRAKSEGKTPNDLEGSDMSDELAWQQRAVWTRYEQMTRANNAFDFDDLVNVVMRAAEANTPVARHLRARWSHVLVDEYQDTSVVQFRLVQQLASSGNLTAVGDVNQSLYAWRGATPDNILNFATTHYPSAKVVDMATNYRSTKNIVSVANAFRSNGQANTPNPTGDKAVIMSFRSPQAEAQFIAREVQRRILAGTAPSECAVLYRNKSISRLIEEELRNRGMGYDIKGGFRFYDRAVVKDVLAFLRLLVNPSSNLDFERIVNVPSRGLGDKAVDVIRQQARKDGTSMLEAIPKALQSEALRPAQREQLMRFAYMYKHAAPQVETARPSVLARTLMDQTRYEEALLTKASGLEAKRKHVEAEDARDDAKHVSEVIDAITAYEGRVKNPTLAGWLDEIAIMTAQDGDSGDRVQLSTVHGFKGLEADAVWVAAFEAGTLPSEHEDSSVAEEKRVAFVALSRARKWLTITYSDWRTVFGRTTPTGPSEFLNLLTPENSTWHERDTKLERAS